MNHPYPGNIELYHDDMPAEYANLVHSARIVAWDIETSGLDWRNDQIATCQLYIPESPVIIVRVGNTPPKELRSLLSDALVKKVFHHAMFDLRFMSYNWGVLSQNITCTKIASKLLDVRNKRKHSLQSLVKQYLGVMTNKNEQQSDWLSSKLTEKQIIYATTDVLYLLPLLDALERELESKGLLELAHACFAHIPTRVQLDLLRYADIYTY